MLEVQSARPCTGAKGQYEIWIHRVRPGVPRSLELLRASPAGGWKEVEQDLGLPKAPAPEAVLELARRSTINGEPARLDGSTVLAASLVRVCDMVNHRDRSRTKKEAHRLEVVTRDLCVPDALGSTVLSVLSPLALDNYGIGRLSVVQHDGSAVTRSVVSAPLTAQEQLATVARFAVPLGSEALNGAVLGLVHVGENGWVERPHGLLQQQAA